MPKINLTIALLLLTLFSSLAYAVVFNNVATAKNIQPADTIKQGAFTFTVDSTSAQGGSILKVNAVTLILNPGQTVHFDVYDITSNKNANNGVDITFTNTGAAQAPANQPVPQVTEQVKINQDAINAFNQITKNAYSNFNFKTKTKTDSYVVTAWKKIKTPASPKDKIESYTFLRGVILCIDKKTNKITCHYETN